MMEKCPITARLINDLPYYARYQLKAKDKTTGAYVPFTLNRAQQYIHQRLEEQKAKTGKVRAIILKGRQQGVSTYIGARFFHKTVTNRGVLTFIFAHDSFGSQNLYTMVKNYYETATDRAFLPALGATNAKELLFPSLLSGYKVGTAGTGEGLGRSATFQAVHWSEVAYSPNCEAHSAGLLQTVPDALGTEIILESTANGQNNYFHRACTKALSGVGDYIMIFVPWYWQPEYTRDAAGMELDNTEIELLDLYGRDGLTLEHLAWRRAKIITDFHGDEYRFKKDYPFHAQEAFEQSDDLSYISANLVIKAREQEPITIGADPPLIIGVDPARMGKNSFRLAFRKGRNLAEAQTFPPLRVDQAADRLIRLIKEREPARVYIDTGGLGVGVYDLCIAAGLGRVVKGVAFGSKQVNYPDRFYNKRAEMYGMARDWLDDAPVSVRLSLEDGDQLQAELSSIRVKRYDANNRLLLESKEEMLDRGVPSPDLADAFVLTFAGSVTEDKANIAPIISKAIQTDISWSPF